MPASPEFPRLLTGQSDLDRLCDAIAAEKLIALDTEFVRTSTYAPQLGLLQLAVDGARVCVDPLAGLDLENLWTLLFAPERTSIIHSAKQDMEVMWFQQGALLHNLIDTQICAGLLGYPAQIGYAGLVAELLDITVCKEQTRTDWTKRPLTAAQIEYAAEDVAHLHTLHEILRGRLLELQRYEWAVEDSLAMADLALYQPDPANAWQRVKSIPFMPPEQQARAMAIAAWREARAVELDKPRQWILADKALLEMAEHDPRTLQQLERLQELPGGLARRHGEALLGVLAAGNEHYAGNPDGYSQQFAERDRDKALSKKLARKVRAKAAELGIAPEILASKRDINALIRGADGARIHSGWRSEIIGRELQTELG